MMNESNVMKIVTGLIAIGITWTLSAVSTLHSVSTGQEVHIQSNIEDIDKVQGTIGAHGERITRLESGMAQKLESLVIRVDKAITRLERLEGK